MSVRRGVALLWLLVLARSAAGDTLLVRYPAGDCNGSGVRIAVELWQPARDGQPPGWAAHPDHPLVLPGSCHPEDSHSLLNELRVRCVDPTGARSPSEWVVGADVFSPRTSEPCAKP
jgi:hypothetical protein